MQKLDLNELPVLKRFDQKKMGKIALNALTEVVHGELRVFVELAGHEPVAHAKAKAVLAIDLLFSSRDVLDFHIWHEEVRI